MATQLLIEDHFNASPQQLFELLTDNAFDDDLMNALNMKKELIKQEDLPNGKGYQIRLSSHEEIPAFAQKFVGDHLSYVETRQWNNATRSNTWIIVPEVKGVTVEAKGTTEIIQTSNGCIRKTTGSISVNLPLIGKKIEQTVLQNITETFRKNADYCRTRLN